MDKKFFRNLWDGRRSAWTFGLCLTGVLVLGSIVAVDSVKRGGESQPETEFEQAYLDEENSGGLSGTDKEEPDEAASASASGNIEPDMTEGQTDMDSSYGQEEADGEEAAASENAEGMSGEVTDNPAEEAEGTGENEETDETLGEEDAQEAASAHVISEEELLAANVLFDEEDTLIWPAAGTILIDYSMDGSVFFPTLNQYKYNPALVIASEAGNQVLSAARGIVESLDVDEVTGLTMTVNIGNGYRLVYGQMKEAAVQEGDIVETGSVLGYVSEPTRFYTREGSNLYFKMTKDGVPVDPVLYLE